MLLKSKPSTISGVIRTPDYSKIKEEKLSRDALGLREKILEAKRSND
jgi:hypothetical protein